MEKLYRKEDGLYVEVQTSRKLIIDKLTKEEEVAAFNEWQSLVNVDNDINDKIQVLEEEKLNNGKLIEEFGGVFDNMPNPSEEVPEEETEETVSEEEASPEEETPNEAY